MDDDSNCIVVFSNFSKPPKNFKYFHEFELSVFGMAWLIR